MPRTTSLHSLLHWLASGLIVLLAGCATAPAPTTHGSPDKALQQRLETISQWQLDGKLAVRTPEQAESARLQWQQDGEAFDIHLSGPAGLKATRLYGMPGGVRFEQGDRRESAGSAEALSERLIGWPLPASQLTWWLRGLPAEHTRTTSIGYTPEGWLAELEQDGWLIRFSHYQPQRDVMLPGRIEASHGNARITLVIKQWQLP